MRYHDRIARGANAVGKLEPVSTRVGNPDHSRISAAGTPQIAFVERIGRVRIHQENGGSLTNRSIFR